MGVEKFSAPELTALRGEVLQGSLDARQAAELFQIFLMGRGYGVSPQAARDAATAVNGCGCTIESLQRELERIALVM
jgi:hypothetical protein